MYAIKGQKKNARRFPGAKGPRPDTYEMRKREAQERQAAYDKLSVKEKIERLDLRFGEGVGAQRHRARLQKALEASQASSKEQPRTNKKNLSRPQPEPRYDEVFEKGTRWLNKQ